MNALLRGLIRLYQLAISPLLGPRCRFLPTCSDYAATALRDHGVCSGGRLILLRLARCHPWGGSGFDPVPPVAPRRHLHSHRCDLAHPARR